MRRTFQYKAKLNSQTALVATRQLALCCELYNAALEERIKAYSMVGVSLNIYTQSAQLPDIKECRPEFAEIGSQVLQNVLERLNLAFQAFFRRCKKGGGKAGFPRFRSRYRYESLTFKQSGWKLGTAINNRRNLTLHGIGTIPLRWSRDLDGCVKTVTLKRDRCGDWFVMFSCDNVSERLLPDTGKSIGIDLGLEAFLTTSDETRVENPRPLAHAQRYVAKAQRRVSKRKKGSLRRRNAVSWLAKHHRKVARIRKDFHHKTAATLVQQYDKIAVEDLNIRGLSRGMFAKSVHDVGWSQFLTILADKAESAGRKIIAVNPSGTSQVCSDCGSVPTVKKPLSQRQHICSECGYSVHRDVNAARNILHLASTKAKARGRAGPSASRLASNAAA